MTKYCAISAGMISPKKGNQPFLRAHRYLNYGLLGLASRLGDEALVYHGHFEEPEHFFSKNLFIQKAPVIILSLPSFYALPWARKFVTHLLGAGSRPEIHIGGRWVIDQNPEFVRAQFPSNVFVHPGMGEKTICALKSRWSPQKIAVDPCQKWQLDYERLVCREEFQPSVEVSRGCGRGCIFCEEANEPLIPLKNPNTLIEEISSIIHCYGNNRNFYFESSLFAPSWDWVRCFYSEYHRRKMSFLWRTETRVDVLGAEKLRWLCDAGLRVIDLGLESASPTQIRRMDKSNDPIRYLRRAAELLRTCHSSGIWAKVNILLFPGETSSTIAETRAFLRENAKSIYGVSTYPVMVYGVEERARYYESLYRAQGATGLRRTELDGIWDVDLSDEIDSMTAKKISLDIAREFMPSRNYFDLKRFSYLDPRYGWEDFRRDASHLDKSVRAFGV